MSIVDDFLSVVDSIESHNVEQMLSVILAKARRYTMSEAGSIFFVDRTDEREPELVACSLQNDRVRMANSMFRMPINQKSIAGYVALTGEIVEIEDLYRLPHDVPYSFNRSFDDKDGYRSLSMLAVPLKNFQGDVIGVVQLLNHMSGVDVNGEPNYQPFPPSYIDDMKSIMIVLGSVLERGLLVMEINRLKGLLQEKESVA